MILVTGGAGFIGSNFILQWIAEEKTAIVNLDKLTSSGNLNNLSILEHNSSYHFVRGDVRNKTLLHDVLRKYRPWAIVHCAALTQSERTLHHPESFFPKNVMGTFELLEEALSYWQELDPAGQKAFRFLNVSTNEVYGKSSPHAPHANEETPYAPTSPYAASKAAADHFVRAYHKTHGLPTLTTHCANNFGPYQFPTKLVPVVLVNALQGNPLDIYGEGNITSSWLYVREHCSALRYVLTHGMPGESYHIGGQAVVTNKVFVESVCRILDDLINDSSYKPHANLIKIVKEHGPVVQKRILDDAKLRGLGWVPKETFDESLHKTIQWYLHNMSWMNNVMSGEYKDWLPAIVEV